jgi:hypothetical protein
MQRPDVQVDLRPYIHLGKITPRMDKMREIQVQACSRNQTSRLRDRRPQIEARSKALMRELELDPLKILKRVHIHAAGRIRMSKNWRQEHCFSVHQLRHPPVDLQAPRLDIRQIKARSKVFIRKLDLDPIQTLKRRQINSLDAVQHLLG